VNEDGLQRVRSRFPVPETLDRLRAAVVAAGMDIFALIDHAAAAAAVGMQLRPTQLLIFGSPRGGTPLMQDRQESGIDLPLKALVWEDQDGSVWVTYNDPHWLASRHGLGESSQRPIQAIDSALAALAEKATSA
jgi:uncharacterized protein (DUF302 family)